MCFVADADWYAQVVVKSTATVPMDAEELPTCDECHRTIKPGQPIHHIFMQEEEDCRNCMGECDCETPDFGETFDYDRCDECHLFLDAVEAAELEDGCSRNEARPALEHMITEIHESNDLGNDLARRYVRKAIELFPELLACGYLARLWRRIYVSNS